MKEILRQSKKSHSYSPPTTLNIAWLMEERTIHQRMEKKSSHMAKQKNNGAYSCTKTGIHVACFRQANDDATYFVLQFRGTNKSDAFTNQDPMCPHEVGQTWKYYDGGWVNAGDGLEVVCTGMLAMKRYLISFLK